MKRMNGIKNLHVQIWKELFLVFGFWFICTDCCMNYIRILWCLCYWACASVVHVSGPVCHTTYQTITTIAVPHIPQPPAKWPGRICSTPIKAYKIQKRPKTKQRKIETRRRTKTKQKYEKKKKKIRGKRTNEKKEKFYQITTRYLFVTNKNFFIWTNGMVEGGRVEKVLRVASRQTD